VAVASGSRGFVGLDRVLGVSLEAFQTVKHPGVWTAAGPNLFGADTRRLPEDMA
jgi:hypothetical protein